MVTIFWSLTNGGPAISAPLDHGTDAAGITLTTQEIFLRHNGVNQITNCGFYAAAYSGSYIGAYSPSLDLAELFEWGDGATAAAFGGFQINMDAISGYLGNWPGWNDKSGSTYNVFRTGFGDSVVNKILLATEMGLISAAGIIQTGSSPNVRFKARVQLPTDETGAGTRQFDQRLRFVYTS